MKYFFLISNQRFLQKFHPVLNDVICQFLLFASKILPITNRANYCWECCCSLVKFLETFSACSLTMTSRFFSRFEIRWISWSLSKFTFSAKKKTTWTTDNSLRFHQCIGLKFTDINVNLIVRQPCNVFSDFVQ